MGELTPFAAGGRWRVYKGDCLEVLSRLADASADCVVADPPYCLGASLEAQRTGGPPQGVRSSTARKEDFEWVDSDQMSTTGICWTLRRMLIECRRILRPDSSAFVFTDWRMVPALVPVLESTGVRWRNLIVWDKGSAALGSGFRPQHELVLEFAKGTNPYYSLHGSNVVSLGRVSRLKKVHAAQKPVALLGDLLRVACRPGGVVLDPFMGSGSTGEVALNLGRDFVGIDLKAAECHRAAARLAQLG